MDYSKYHFGGYATRNDIVCTDGRIIRKDAFKHNHGKKVPLIWNHDHSTPEAVLGEAVLEHRDDGVYAYGTFNDTEAGQHAKKLVEIGNVRSLSIYANKLKQVAKDVFHGDICELSLVLAGANPGAFVDTVMAHGDGEEDGLIINYDESAIVIYHSAEPEKEEIIEHSEEKKEEKTMGDIKKSEGDLTVGEVWEGIQKKLDETEMNVIYAIIGQAQEDFQGGESMKQNVFENDTTENSLMHSEIVANALADMKRYGSLKESLLAHSTDTEYAEISQTYGINGTDYLFPEAKNLNTPPEFIKRDTGWVSKVMSGVHHSPFSRIKSMFADITEDDARARGYIKGKLKKEEVFGLLKRTTTPTTIYKKQKLDRDDVIDITDFDVVAWLRAEMRMMLDEELARAFLVGDGRNMSSDDKINEQHIRPIWTDEDLFTIKTSIKVKSTDDSEKRAKAFIRGIIKSRKNYKGSGEPTLYTTEDVLTDCLLIEDATGRIIYDSVQKLASVLRVKEIVTVPVLEGLKRTTDESKEVELAGIIVNLKDYNVGADKGGAVNMFDDFDIDYNAQKYLIETRCSGALIKPYSAIAVEFDVETVA